MPFPSPSVHAWLAALALAALLSAPGASAEPFPARPLRIVLPVGPGSSGDTMTRFVAERLGAALGQPVVVENRPGAEGLIAMQSVLNAPADGYGMLVVSPSTVAGSLASKDAYDVQRDVRVLSYLYRSSVLLVSGRDSRFATVDQAMAQVRATPGAVSLADYGTTYRVAGLHLAQQGGLVFNQISYKGFPQASADVIGGTVELGLVDAGAALPLVRAGKLRALASTGTRRIAELPDVPTLRESGFPDYTAYGWVAFGVPRKTPEAVAQRLEKEVAAIARSPEYLKLLATFAGTEPMTLAGTEADRHLALESTRIRKVIESAPRQASR